MGPPLWSSGSWLQIQRSGIDSRSYQIFWEVEDLERVTLSLVSTTEELLGRNNNVSGLESREYGRRDQLRWPCDTLYQQKLALTSPTSGGPSVGIVPSRSQTTEFFYYYHGSTALCWALAAFLVPKSYTQLVGLLEWEISPRRAAN
jgi:hypothetical protein